MKGVYILGGSRLRKPHQTLVKESGSEVNSKDHPEPTNETIHFSVRVLLSSSLWRCEALTKYRLINADSTVIWKLLHKNGKETKIQLPEETLGPTERDLLTGWMQAEMGKRKRSGQGPTDPDGGAKDLALWDILLPYLKLH